MTERPDNTRLHYWLDDTVGQIPDRVAGARQVMSQIEETPQAGRWLPFRVFRRKAKAHIPTTTDTTGFQASPIPATNGHTPTVIGRTQTMFSPVKAITAGALVFAVGGVLLIAQPFERQDSVPGAETEAVAPTWVTGSTQHVEGSCATLAHTRDGGVNRSRFECTHTWTSSDPRLTGDVTGLWNEDTYKTDDDVISVGMDAHYLRNEGGSWACSSGYLAKGTTPSTELLSQTTSTCIGGGGYEGLSAVLVREPNEDFSDDFFGLIFSGSVPPVPEPPAAE